MFMVILVNWSKKFISIYYIDRENWVFWVVLLAELFLQCLHVPGCIGSQKTVLARSPRSLSIILQLLFHLILHNFLIMRVFWSARARKSSLECEWKGEMQTGCSSSWNQWHHWFQEEQDFEAAFQRHRGHWEKILSGFTLYTKFR